MGSDKSTGTMNTFIEVPLDRLLYTVDEACRLLSIRRTTMFALLKDGTITSVKIGRARRIHRDVLTDFAQAGAP